MSIMSTVVTNSTNLTKEQLDLVQSGNSNTEPNRAPGHTFTWHNCITGATATSASLLALARASR